MLEFFRKYSAFAFIVLIILFIGLVFLVDGLGGSGAGSGPKLMKLNGREYAYSEVERQGSDYYKMLFGLRSGNYIGEAEFAAPYMIHIAQMNPQTGAATDETTYYANRLILKGLAEEYGVIPSQEQIENTIQKTLFVNDAGKFDQAGYAKFILNRVKKYGLGVKDLNTLVGEIISMNKLEAIIGTGFTINPDLVRRGALVNLQTLTFDQFTLPLEKLKDTITVTDEEVKAYWEKNTNNYLTDPQVKVQYVISDAGITAAEKKHKDAQLAAAKAEGKSEEEIAALDTALPADQRTQLMNAAIIKADSLFTQVQDEDGRGFEKVAKELGLEATTSEFFTESSAPADFQLTTQSGTPAAVALSLSGEVDTMDAMSDIYPLGGGRNLIFRVLERIEAEPLSYEQAQADAKSDLIQSKLDESQDTLTGDIREQLVTAAKDGKLIEKAQELGMTHAQFTDKGIRDQVEGETYFFRAFQDASKIADQEISEPIVQDIPQLGLERVLFVRPTSRKFVETEEAKSAIKTQIDGSADGMNYVVFSNWFDAQRAQAQFVRLAAQ